MTVVVHRVVLDRLLRGPTGAVGVQLQRSGIRIEGGARLRCPVDTGRLRSSLHTTNVIRRGDELVVRVGTNVRYARFVELGTRHARAQPYLRPALRKEFGRVVI